MSDQVEIIYISSDRAVADFEAYFGKMPWLSLPAVGTAQIKNQLAQACQIAGIPALLVLERVSGHYITNEARNHVEQWKRQGGDKVAAKQVVAQWKATPAVPLSEANLSAGGGGGIMGIVTMIAKNPAMMFGILYFLKVGLFLLCFGKVCGLGLARPMVLGGMPCSCSVVFHYSPLSLRCHFRHHHCSTFIA